MAASDLEFLVLGPVQLAAGGRPRSVDGAKQRALLALLTLEVDWVAERDWLIEQLWAGEPPKTAKPTLRAYIYQLRKQLTRFDCGAALRSEAGGYALEVAAEAVDAHRFEALADQGRYALQDGKVEDAIAAFREGLGLWRGTAAFAGVDVPAVRVKARLLDQLRLEVTEQCLGAVLETEAPSGAVAELEALTAAHPLREELWRLLMLGLYRAGRQGEALGVYQRLYRLLDEELGIRPSAPLEQLHRQILTADPQLRRPAGPPGPVEAMPRLEPAGDPPVPRQLPPSAVHFTGRAPQLAELNGLFACRDGRPGAVGMAVLTGIAGIGKSALAVHWGHQVADRFPDGQLYIDLRGFDPVGRPMAAADAVRAFLDALGVPAAKIPADSDAQAGLYRSLLADKRVLVVLDNARDTEQVRPLLPGASGSLVVVTSRDRLSGLIARGAHPITVTQLDAEDAGRFLRRRLGDSRPAAEPEAAERIIDACAGLPLALAIVAARTAAHPDFPLATLATELCDPGGRLDVLADPDPAIDVRTVFSWSYRALTADAARLFRLLSAHPGPDITPTAAGAVLGAEPQEAARLLTELTRANLLDEQQPGRYSFHDLLRAYATALAGAEDARDDQDEAARRLLDFHLHTAYAANRLIDPNRDPIFPPPRAPGVTPVPLADDKAAMAWFETEGAVLLAVVEHAAERGADTHCWQLAWTLRDYLVRGRCNDGTAVWRTALEAALRLGDIDAHVRMSRLLAQAYSRLGRFEEGHALLDGALVFCRRLNDLTGEAHVHRMRGLLSMREGRLPEAIESHRRALDLYEAADYPAGRANALNSTGWCHALAGDHEQALSYCERAMALMREVGDRHGQAATSGSLGYAYHRLGRHDRAVACYRHAVDLYRDLGKRRGEAKALVNLGEAQRAVGDAAAARRSWRRALAVFEDLDHCEAEQVRVKLAGLTGSSPC
jgi:DNA-binding SARP family transcriptional activator